MSEATSGVGADPTPAAPASPALETPVSGSLLTDGQQGEQQTPGSTTPATGEGEQADPNAGESDGGGGKPAPEGAPEAYEDFTAPEGVHLDATVLEEFKGLAKELNLPQGQAQKVADLLGKQTQAAAAAQVGKIQQVNAEWIQQTQGDPEIGGEKLAENLAAARAAMDATTTPQLRELLKRTGLGNNPEVIRHFLKIAPAFAEDKHVPGGVKPAGAGKSAAQVLYPTS